MPETEAACLLRSGSAFANRLGLRTKSGLEILAGFKPGGASLYYGDAPIYHFDLEGRWQRAFVAGVHYLKGLDGAVRSIDRIREGENMVLRRGTLAFAESTDLDASIRSAALDLIEALDANDLELINPPVPAQVIETNDLRDFLERVTTWDSTAWFAHRERYLATYGIWPFLPPDCSNAIVLQATLGHRDGLVFGQSKPAEHYARSIAEFEEHATAVARLLGRRISQSRTVFLGGSDVLTRPIDETIAMFGISRRIFSVGVHAFLDAFDRSLPDLDGWRKLRSSGLDRVTLGVESGDPGIRSGFGRTWADPDLIEAVAAMKTAGIGLGLIILVGAGGRSKADVHRSSSIELLDRLSLGEKDIITLVDARSFNDSAEGPLSDLETAEQTTALKRGLAGKGLRIVAYNLDKQSL